MMRQIVAAAVLLLSVVVTLSPAAAADDLAKRLGDVLAQAPSAGEWQVKAADLAKMIEEKKTDFLVVDVRPAPPSAPVSWAERSPGPSTSRTTKFSRMKTTRSRRTRG